MSTAISTRANVESLLAAVEGAKATLAAYLPDGVSIDRFVALAKRQVLDNPRLAECASASVLRALSAAAASGLPIDGHFSTLLVRDSKHGKPSATWDPTFRGMITLALASGFVLDVQSGVVREHDEFTLTEGSSPALVHRRSLLPNHGAVIAAWATAKLRTGGLMVEVLTLDDIARIKAMSPAGDRGPWGAWADQMARKSAVRRLLKRLPAGVVRLSDPLDGTALAERPAVTGLIEQAPKALEVMPEELHVLECQGLERLHDASDAAQLQVAWLATLAAFQQRGAAIPLKLEAAHHDLRESHSHQAAAQ